MKPTYIDGFEAFAPELAATSEGFREEFFLELAGLEEGNFWFRSRNELILWGLGKFGGDFKSLLEVGCGTGYVLCGVKNRFREVALTGSEISTAGLVHAKKRLPGVRLIQMDAREIPFKNEFDAIGAFDVIEHIAEDELVLRQLHEALTARGLMIITVPQHAWLWSAVDESACHVRRYDAADLHNKIARAGFEVLCSTSFVFGLLPGLWLSRLLHRPKKADEHKDALDGLRLPKWLDILLTLVMKAEFFLIRTGIRFPVGGSRLVIARKK